MIKIISSEEYVKLIVDVNYWKVKALQEETMKQLYKEENDKLKAEIKRLEELINNEHKCDKNCFAEHVLSAIQSDYDKCNNSSNLIRNKFIEYWSNKLYDEYDFVQYITLINDKLAVKYI